ncbi:MAG: recombinase family protein [Leptolyngbyaceae cyanobacterium]
MNYSKERGEDAQAPLRIIGYARVSSREQAHDSQALDQQRERVLTAGAADVLEDVLSGRDSDRPSFNRLMEMVQNGEVDEVVFTRIDRLTRSLADLTQCIRIFQESGVNLRILDQDLNLSTPTGKLMANLLGAVAEWEADLLSERVRHGKAYRRHLGLASESAPRGYLSEAGQYQLNQTPVLCLLSDRPTTKELLAAKSNEANALTVADIAQDLVALFLETKTTRATLKQFYEQYGIRRPRQASKSSPRLSDSSERAQSKAIEILYWTESGLRNWLMNPVLEGNTAYLRWIQRGKRRVRSTEPPEIHTDTHPEQALISHEEAAYIRETFAIYKQMGGGSFIKEKDGLEDQYRPYAYLTGLTYCYQCGSRCRTKTSKKGAYSYFVCPHAGKGCDNRKSVPKASLEKDLIRQLVAKSKSLRRQAASTKSGINSTKAAILANQGKSQAEISDYLQKNAAGYKDLIEHQGGQEPTSERLEGLKKQLDYLEKYPLYNPTIAAEKESIQNQIEEEEKQLNSVLRKSAGEIIYEGDRLVFWDTLPEHYKVDIYPRIIERLFVQNGHLKQANFKLENPEK